MTAEDGINVVTGIGASFSLLGNVILAVIVNDINNYA